MISEGGKNLNKNKIKLKVFHSTIFVTGLSNWQDIMQPHSHRSVTFQVRDGICISYIPSLQRIMLICFLVLLN